jgi:hypothetical protein
LLFIFTEIPARVGLIFHSAEENRVFSIDFLTTLPERLKLTSSLIAGIKGNSFASNHFIFNFQLADSILIDSLLPSSI